MNWICKIFGNKAESHEHKYSNTNVSYWDKWEKGLTYPTTRIMSFDCIKCGFHYFARSPIIPTGNPVGFIPATPPESWPDKVQIGKTWNGTEWVK